MLSRSILRLLRKRNVVKPLQNFDGGHSITNIRHLITANQSYRNYNFLQKHTTQLFLESQRFATINVAETNDDLYLNDNNVTVIGNNIPNPYTSIENSEFPDYIKKYLQSHGIDKPTPIQSHGWPIALSGQNFVGIAQTGTGKTLAYLLPAIVHIKEKKARKGKGPIVLVLAPTRELARQIDNVAREFGPLLNIRTACIYGGASRLRQAEILQNGVDMVIATPGRLNDFLTSKDTNVSRSTYVVLDEADRMLDMGFEPQIRQALEGVPLERQILMWSATWPKEVQTLAKDYLGEFVQVNVGSTDLCANHNIKQHVYVCDQTEKLDKFKSIIHDLSGGHSGKILVFANTKKFVDTLTLVLKRTGWQAAGIHGDKTQLQRDTIIYNFKNGRSNILVATDVAARGLDVDGISHVINYDYPNTAEDYIHRIGRTGRSSSKGESHTILTSENSRQVGDLIDVLKEAGQDLPPEVVRLGHSHEVMKYKGQEDRRPIYFKKNNFNWNHENKFNRFRKRY